ncbi:peroxidase-related enzyme [Gracilimonas sp.]|uniref:peroxidase-related enzyme n=1 Tax=Gracilimonas sp. TaxID=1974203 RepID=UPI0028715EBD|nr:peroxidase-related enzyme [Gracilimonas sp.]
MPFIEVIEPKNATGNLKKIYEDLTKSRGKLAMVHKIQSLNPESITAHMDLYMQVMFGKSPLKRAQREMMAVVVSAANKCEYCQLHHAEALNHYWRDEQKVNQLRRDFSDIELSELDLQLCRLAEKLTKKSHEIDEQQDLKPLKELGLSDRAILDATLVISYFNFVNRMVLGLGVATNEEEMRGYNY